MKKSWGFSAPYSNVTLWKTMAVNFVNSKLVQIVYYPCYEKNVTLNFITEVVFNVAGQESHKLYGNIKVNGVICLPMPEKEINDDKIAVCFEERCFSDDICNFCDWDQSKAFYLPICHKTQKQQRLAKILWASEINWRSHRHRG